MLLFTISWFPWDISELTWLVFFMFVASYPRKMEDDEEKVVKLLKSANGQLYQSLIAKHCSFSTSKTSELLTSMENKGIITRTQKGREKLVTLIKED